jgi:hypothetical protein
MDTEADMHSKACATGTGIRLKMPNKIVQIFNRSRSAIVLFTRVPGTLLDQDTSGRLSDTSHWVATVSEQYLIFPDVTDGVAIA